MAHRLNNKGKAQPLIYLASPYSHKSKLMRNNRFKAIATLAGVLISKGHVVFSPIVHSHVIQKMCPKITGTSWDFWADQDIPLLNKCDELWIADMLGVDVSTGVRAEVLHAIKRKIPISIVMLGGYHYEVSVDELMLYFGWTKRVLKTLIQD